MNPADWSAKGLTPEQLEAAELEPLEPQQLQFVHEYMIDGNATQAAIRAGYSRKAAAQVGGRLRRKPNVAHTINKIRAQRISKVNVTADAVLFEMSALAHSSIEWFSISDEGRLIVNDTAPANAMAAVQSFKRKHRRFTDAKTGDTTDEYDCEIKLWDKPTPLKLMGRHVGLFPDKMEITGKDGGAIEQVVKIERIIIDPPSS